MFGAEANTQGDDHQGPRGRSRRGAEPSAAMDKAMAQKATASDDSPIPGYMYGEFAKQTLASYEACRQLEEYLLKRIVNKNPNVKLKSLLIMKHVALKGRPDFKRDLMRSLGPIKDCLQFSGPPDPLRGDEVYVKIRATAREALEAITTNDPLASAGVGADRIQGLGSDIPSGFGSEDRNRAYQSFTSAPYTIVSIE